MNDSIITMRIDLKNGVGGEEKYIETEIGIPNEKAGDIDYVEQAFLQANRKTIITAISCYLEGISKKETLKEQEKSSGRIEENTREYKVDGEVGRFTFQTHRLYSEDNRVIFDSSQDYFQSLKSKEWYRTEGFNEISMGFATECSYRKATHFLNRSRGAQGENATPDRTLAHIVETEGSHIQHTISEKSQEILAEHSFTSQGQPIDNAEEFAKDESEVALPVEVVEQSILDYNQDREDEQKIDPSQADEFYEDANNTINISLDEVGVKKQKESGRSSQHPKKEKREFVYTTIADVQQGDNKYVLSAIGITALMPILVAFLLYNNLMKYHLLFFVDGAKNLKNSILTTFGWFKSITIILDWYHLKKKCEQQLSLALKGREIRNLVLEKLLSLLWLGELDKAIAYLESLDKKLFKADKSCDSLVGYLIRNREFIPCYALRKKLGLRNSSNRAEKDNDLAVSTRQKHNGMSWSKSGSTALATVTVLHLNGEQMNWYRNKDISFKMVA